MKNLIYLWLLLSSQVVYAQQVYNPQKFSGYLRNLIAEQSVAQARGQAHNTKTVCTLIKLQHNEGACQTASKYGCQILDSIGDVFIVNVPVPRLGQLSTDSSIIRIEAHKIPRPAMNEVPALIRADQVWQGINLPQAFNGHGVVSGVVDFGFDFTHPMFHDNKGASRILRFFDMTSTSEDNEKGITYTAHEIDSLEHSTLAESQTHGTHVASIMAGSIIEGGKNIYSGVAPNCDIALAEIKMETIIDAHGYVVSGDLKNSSDGTTANLLLAFKRIFDYADKQGQPCVINYSGGFHMPIDDPCILENEAIDALVGPGHIIVSSSGNDGGLPSTMTKTIEDSQVTASFYGTSIREFNLTQYYATAIDLYLVTEDPQNISFIIGSDNYGKVVNLYTHHFLEDTLTIAEEHAQDTIIIEAYREKNPPLYIHGDLFRFVLTLVSDKSWRNISDYLHYSTINNNNGGIRVMLWGEKPCEMYTNPVYTPFIPALSPYTGERSDCLSYQHTVGWPAETENVIAVGATYKSGSLTSFSSQGPSWSGKLKPEVVAPGIKIYGAYNNFSNNFNSDQGLFYDKLTDDFGKVHYLWPQSGTSMSSPIVAGTIALWLQAKPDLSPSDIKDVLAQTSKHINDNHIDGYPNNMYGYGEIDAYAGLLYILGIPNNIDGISMKQPSSINITLDGRNLIVKDAMTGRPYLGEVLLKVYTVNGKCVAQGHQNIMNLSGFTHGIYVIQVDTKEPSSCGSTLIRL